MEVLVWLVVLGVVAYGLYEFKQGVGQELGEASDSRELLGRIDTQGLHELAKLRGIQAWIRRGVDSLHLRCMVGGIEARVELRAQEGTPARLVASLSCDASEIASLPHIRLRARGAAELRDWAPLVEEKAAQMVGVMFSRGAREVWLEGSHLRAEFLWSVVLHSTIFERLIHGVETTRGLFTSIAEGGLAQRLVPHYPPIDGSRVTERALEKLFWGMRLFPEDPEVIERVRHFLQAQPEPSRQASFEHVKGEAKASSAAQQRLAFFREALEHMEFPVHEEAIEAALGASQPELRLLGIKALGSEGFPELVALLEDPDNPVGVRAEAAGYLVAEFAPAIALPLLEKLEAEGEPGLWLAVFEGKIQLALRRLEDHPQASLLQVALAQLCEHLKTAPQSEEALGTLLREWSWLRRQLAGEQGPLLDDALCHVLSPPRSSEPFELPSPLLNALIQLDGPAAAPWLLLLLRESPSLLVPVARGLGLVGNAEAVEKLSQALESRELSSNERRVLKRAIARIQERGGGEVGQLSLVEVDEGGGLSVIEGGGLAVIPKE